MHGVAPWGAPDSGNDRPDERASLECASPGAARLAPRAGPVRTRRGLVGRSRRGRRSRRSRRVRGHPSAEDPRPVGLASLRSADVGRGRFVVAHGGAAGSACRSVPGQPALSSRRPYHRFAAACLGDPAGGRARCDPWRARRRPGTRGRGHAAPPRGRTHARSAAPGADHSAEDGRRVVLAMAQRVGRAIGQRLAGAGLRHDTRRVIDGRLDFLLERLAGRRGPGSPCSTSTN